MYGNDVSITWPGQNSTELEKSERFGTRIAIYYLVTSSACFERDGIHELPRARKRRLSLRRVKANPQHRVSNSSSSQSSRLKKSEPDRMKYFGIVVRDEAQLAEVREKMTKKYGLKLIPGFRCDFRDPFGNRIQVVDLHDELLVWLLPYQEVQKAGTKFLRPLAA